MEDKIEKELRTRKIRRVKFSGSFELGHIYSYRYNPKYKDILSFYDTAPLIFFIGINEHRNILGLNIHFLPMKQREKLFADIKYRDDNKAFDFSVLRGLKIIRQYFPIIIRSYISERISKLFTIPMNRIDLENIEYLPTEKFYGKTSDEIFKLVYRERLRK